MASFSSVLFYIFTFLSVYVQVFLLLTFFENKKNIIFRREKFQLLTYPEVTVIIPCWNEEKTIEKTVRSLFALNYPKDKIHIFLIDDGSTDGTLKTLEEFATFPHVKIFHKENGGKHTALNLGLEHVKTEFLACLDADSFADSESLIRQMSYFERDPSIMAVAPSIIVDNPKNIIQKAQKAEYYMSVYTKKMLGFLGAIHVTPGPLTVFRRKVFDDLGPYRSAHNTEDMEIAYRMQKNHYRIEQCSDAYVYTNTPPTLGKLYRQRLRWIYGFINNTLDYRKMFMKKKYGHFSTFTIPAGVISIFAVSFLFGRLVYSFSQFISSKIVQFKTVGFHLVAKGASFDPFFINTKSLIFVTIFLYTFVVLSVLIGYKMARGKWGVSIDMIYFFSIFTIIAPFWLMKALYATIFSRKPAWR